MTLAAARRRLRCAPARWRYSPLRRLAGAPASVSTTRARRRRIARADGVDYVPTRRGLPLRAALLGDRRRRADRRADPRLPGLRLGARASLWIALRRGLDRRGARLLGARRLGPARRRARSPRSRARELGDRRRPGHDGVHLDRPGLRHRRLRRHHAPAASSPAARSSPGARPTFIPAARSPRRACSTSGSRSLLGRRSSAISKPPLWLVTVDLRAGDLRGLLGRARELSTLLVLDANAPGRSRSSPTARSLRSLPVWALLQPRGYLGGFVLYSALGDRRRRPALRRLRDRAAGFQGLGGAAA